MVKNYEVIVIGAGQAGLAAGYFLKQKGLSFQLLDEGSAVGETWRSRYDSLKLFTPRASSQLPGLPMKGAPDGFPGKDEVADYLAHYADIHELPVKLNARVTRLTSEGTGFSIVTGEEEYKARQVMITTGPFRKPFIPAVSEQLSTGVVQLHSSEYKNPSQLHEGAVLVAGGGNSGAQIALELAESGREVHLAVSRKLRFAPLQIMNRSVFWWLDRCGVLNAPADSLIGRTVRRRPDPVFVPELKRAIRNGTVRLRPRVTGQRGGTIQFADHTELEARNIVWATGFRPDYAWLNVPVALDKEGNPLHERGISPVGGLYYLGLPWLRSRNSALLGGVGADARYVVDCLTNFTYPIK
ncbi:flavin-containing monooxygenase [Paenibacillus allorhizosphaerae]|uniref:Oxidoreductase CzcO n=1 Tax=Paenibacillus allorhizosphaerae TaxID=2849866 RepID=A0ABM8VF24_9BACL|nr:NAD(P)/FAD-dependent oxidoreductase [Paenibacillus allorhizosphaerae]CAG7633342.1 putative oxidoreductase CzcO [Paenibacillus allorhizosphaerae]